MHTREREKDNRRDWLIVLFIILIGFLCILLAGGWALRLTRAAQVSVSRDAAFWQAAAVNNART